MKKTLAVIMAVALMVVLSISAMAAPSTHNAQLISVTGGSTTLNVGESVNLSAVVLKQGSSFEDSWTNCQSVTVFNTVTGNYESNARFTATQPGIFNITYTIVMSAGKSGTNFTTLTDSITITVLAPNNAPTITGINAVLAGYTELHSNTTDKNNNNGKGNSNTSFVGWNLNLNIYVVYSDGTSTLYNQVSKVVNSNAGNNEKVNVTIGGITYSADISPILAGLNRY